MTNTPPAGATSGRPDLAPIVDRLEAVAGVVQHISDEVGPDRLLGADLIIERHRPQVYAAMEALGRTIHEFLESEPAQDRVAAAQAMPGVESGN